MSSPAGFLFVSLLDKKVRRRRQTRAQGLVTRPESGRVGHRRPSFYHLETCGDAFVGSGRGWTVPRDESHDR